MSDENAGENESVYAVPISPPIISAPRVVSKFTVEAARGTRIDGGTVAMMLKRKERGKLLKLTMRYKVDRVVQVGDAARKCLCRRFSKLIKKTNRKSCQSDM